MPQGKGTYGKQVGRPPKKAYKKGGKAKKYQEGGKILQGAGGTDLRDIDAYGKVSDVARFKKAMDIEAKGSQQEDQVMFQKHQAENRGPGYAGGYDEYSVSRNLDVGDQTAAHNESYELWDKVMKEHPEEFDKIMDEYHIASETPFRKVGGAYGHEGKGRVGTVGEPYRTHEYKEGGKVRKGQKGLKELQKKAKDAIKGDPGKQAAPEHIPASPADSDTYAHMATDARSRSKKEYI